MNPALTGKAAAVAAARPYVILATDRHRTGRPVPAVTEDFRHAMTESKNSRFARFSTETEARDWVEANRSRLNGKDFRYTVTDL